MKRRQRKKLQDQLLTAAGWGSPRRVTELLRAGADPNLPDRHGTTPLYRASVQGRAGNVRVLVAAGADPHVESGTREEGLPLCAAACWGHDDAVRELLAAGADPGRREDAGQGHSAIDWAAIGGHTRTVELMNGFIQQAAESCVDGQAPAGWVEAEFDTGGLRWRTADCLP